SGDPSFRETLRRVREVTLGAYEHQEVPFERLVAELQPERSLSHSPLFQVSFSVHTPEGSGPRLPGLRIERAYANAETAKFDLSLAFIEGAESLRASLNYSTDLFDESTVRRMLGHLERVLEQVSADADVRLSELRLLGQEERQRTLVGWNATEAEYPADLCIHHLFEAQVARTPAAVAVVYEGEALSYAELNARANQLAHFLGERGVGPDVRVGISMERSLEMAVALLAILKAGGAYVPLDPSYPADRLRQMLGDSRPVVLLADGSGDAIFAGSGVPVIDVQADASSWASHPATDPESADLSPEHLCYVIYTSGSTGTPKGVMNPHRNVVNRLVWGERAWGLGATMLCKTSLNFDGSLRELFWPWSVGARVVLARPEGHRDPDYLLATLHREGITTVNLVPSMLQVLLEHPQVEERLAGLKQVLCGGEAVPEALLRRFHERLPHVALHNLYGPSEAATAMTALNCMPEEARATVPIGRPTGNVRVYVLDGAGEPVPVGVPGELYIGGTGVSRGYLDRAAQTAERFVPDPFGAATGARLYRTGDLARWLADGRIEFLGRNDFQVKIRGFRVELGEIEAVLRRQANVAECAVIARAEAGETRLVAYVVGSPEMDALRQNLRQSLPDYMVPAAFVALDRLPLTPNGKLDRRALPAPELASAEDRYVAPRTPTEDVLAGIWAELLGR
ncbi:MAG TPA: amino acid adenylation domain-containing protein, partial [Longimicrobium sp.]|nr:amino acid adenylation domain-containing protein [Longimicrobium sp.]